MTSICGRARTRVTLYIGVRTHGSAARGVLTAGAAAVRAVRTGTRVGLLRRTVAATIVKFGPVTLKYV